MAIIVDPPVGLYSDPAELDAWVNTLETLDTSDPDVATTLAQARRWLELARTAVN